MQQEIHDKTVSDQTFVEPISLNKDSVIASGYAGYSAHIEIAYSLTRADFQILMQSQRKIDFWLCNISLLTLGWGANIICKYLSSKFSGSEIQYQNYEFWLLGFGFFTSLILFITSKCVTNPQKEMFLQIADHFKNSPVKRVSVKSE